MERHGPTRSPEKDGGLTRLQPNLELLRELRWSPITSADTDIRPLDTEDVAEFARPANTPAGRQAQVTALAYHALELATGLKPLMELAREQEPASDPAETRRTAISKSVARELVAASHAYALLKQTRTPETVRRLKATQHRLEDMTHTFTPQNTDFLNALAKLRAVNAGRPKVDHMLGRDADYVLRLFVAKEQGLIEDYDSIPL